MNTKIERIITFIKKEKIRNFFAFVFYILIIIESMEIDLPSLLEIIFIIIIIPFSVIVFPIYTEEWLDKKFERNIGKLRKNIIQEIKKIAKEMLKFIPIWLVSCLVATLFSIGEVANEKRLHELFYEGPIFYSIYIIIIGPIIEEFIFRFLPYRFIKK